MTQEPLLPFLPDESLFSLVSRHHRLWGDGASQDTTRACFGHDHCGSQHDFPTSLGHLAGGRLKVLGVARDVARERTLLRFYLPFLSVIEIATVVESMLRTGRGRSGFVIVRSPDAAHYPLKACLDCMRYSVKEHGWVYWKLTHQFPGCWICPVHCAPLYVCRIKWNGVRRNEWVLPSRDGLAGDWADSMKRVSFEQLSRLGELIRRLVCPSLEIGWVSAAGARLAIRARLNEHGWVTAAGSVRLKEAARSFIETLMQIRVAPDASKIPIDVFGVALRLGRMVEDSRERIHPIRYLIAVHWLFSDADDFIRSLRSS